MQTSHSCQIVLEIGRANNILITLSTGEVRLYFLEIDLRDQIKGKGQNYENQNVENQKDLQNLRRRSEHRKE